MAADKKPEVPAVWYFYNLKQTIDDPYKAFSANCLDSITSRMDPEDIVNSCQSSLATLSPRQILGTGDAASGASNNDSKQPLYSKATMRRSVSPITEWIAFNPNDNARLNAAAAKGSTEPVAVGHDRLLFEVHHLSVLKPIYWSFPYSTRVTATRWVFNDTLTPIDPQWNQAILPHFQNFVDNLSTYEEILEKAQTTDPAVMRVVVQRLELQQAGRPLPVELLFSPRNSSVYMFKADSSYVCTKQAASALLNGTIPRGIITVLRPFDFGEYKKYMGLPDRDSDNLDYEPAPVNNLILVFHGVGQKLSSSYTRVNFVYAIDKLRVEILRATESPDVYGHFPDEATPKGNESSPASNQDQVSDDSTDYAEVSPSSAASPPGGPGRPKKSVRNLVLAVNWRSAFGSEHIPDLSEITVPSLLSLRQAFSDAMLDIPLYMSENRRPAMLAAAATEANRLYDLVVARHPSFAQNGRTHVVGHSLGSLITADLLTHQPTTLDATTIRNAPLKFQTHNYFITGSMLGVFMLLKGEKIVPRSEYDRKHGHKHLNDLHKKRPLGCFAVRNIYNIIHQLDLLSFLLNSTVEGADAASVRHLTGKEGLRLEADELPAAAVPASSTGSLLSSFTSHAPGAGSLSTTASIATSSSALALASVAASSAAPGKTPLGPPMPDGLENSNTLASSPLPPSSPTPPSPSPAPVSPSVTSPSPASSSGPGSPRPQSPTASPSAEGSKSGSPLLGPSKEGLASASSSSISTLSKLLSSPFQRFMGSDEAKMSSTDTPAEHEDSAEVPAEVDELKSRLQLLNENGQLDWKVPQPASYIPSHYLKMFTAHFDYWSNKDIARFIAIECGRRPGVEHTLPEHRPKWAYKPTDRQAKST